MSENQLASYANIATQKVIPNEQYDPTINLIGRLQMLAIKPQEEQFQQRGNELVQPKKTEAEQEEHRRINDETRAKYAGMKEKRTNLADTNTEVLIEAEYASLSSRDILRFLPPFIKKIAEHTSASRELVHSLVDYAIDRGMSMSHEFQDKFADKVDILNRAAFATLVLKDKERRRWELMWKYAEQKVRKTDVQLDQEVDAMYSFQQYDIKDFRASDFAKDVEGNRGADYTINKVGLRVNKLVTQINNIFRTQKIDALVSLCRYGGDEVCLAYLNIPPELRSIINAAVMGLKEEDGADMNYENGIKSVRGFFDRGGVILEENVNTKQGIAELTVPMDPIDKAIFWEQFSLGLILGPDEIETIRLQREADPTIPAARQITEVFIADHEGFVAYAEKLKQRHPEIASMIDQMVEFQKEIPEIKDQFPEYINNIVYDRLLGEKVTAFQDFTEHLTKGSFKEMFMFDMKMIKEFNDVQSIATGDQAIVTLWNSIGNQIGPEDFAKVMCFRRGSTFIVGIRDGVEATQDLINRLQSIRSVNFQGNDFNIGFHHRKVERTFTGDKQGRKEIRNWLEESIVDTHENWNQEIITKYLRYNRDILNEVKIDKGTRFTPEQGLALFFNGKRAIERYDRLIEVTTSMGIDAKIKESTQTLGPNEWTSEEYIHLKKQVLDRLFTVVIPHKLEEYESKSDPSKRDEIKIRETLNKWAELAKKYNYPINTD